MLVCCFGGAEEVVRVVLTCHPPPQQEATNPNQKKHRKEETFVQLWTSLFPILHVDLKITAPQLNENGKSGPIPLFHQELDLARHQQVKTNDEAIVQYQFTIAPSIKPEFWTKYLHMVVRVWPQEQDASDLLLSTLQDKPRDAFLSQAFVDLCMGTSPTTTTDDNPTLAKKIQQIVVVSNPLELKTCTRSLGYNHISVIASVRNVHQRMPIQVMDCHFHLKHTLFQQQDKTLSTSNSCYLASEDTADFPVVLHPREQYNFRVVLAHQTIPEVNDQQQKHRKRACVATEAEQLILLTITWIGEGIEMQTPITEHRLLNWIQARSDAKRAALLSEPRVTKQQPQQQQTINFVHRDDTELVVSMQTSHLIVTLGVPFTVWLTVVNKSARKSMDLILQPLPASPGSDSFPPSCLSFQVMQPLG